MRRRTSLRTQLTLQFVTVALLPAALIGWISLQFVGRSLEREISTKNRSIALALAGEIGRFLEAPMNVLTHLAETVVRRDLASSEKLDPFLNDVLGHYPFFESIQILNADGMVTHVAPYDPSHVMLDMSSEPMFTGAFASGEPHWSPGFVSPLSGHPTVTLSVPFRGGVVVGHLALGALTVMTDRLNAGGYGNAVITDQTGTVIAHPRQEFVLRRENLGNLRTVRGGLAGTRDTFRDIIDGREYLGSVAVVPGAGWLALYFQPAEIAFLPLTNIRRVIAVGLVLSSLVAVLLARLGIRRTLRPLSALVSAVQVIAGGRFSRLPSPRSYREIEVLTENVNAMSDAIETRETALQESEERLRRFHDAALEGILVSVDGLVVDANRRIGDMLGYEPGELIGLEFLGLVADEDRKAVMARMTADQTEPFRMRALRKDGTLIDVEAAGRGAQVHGRPARIYGIYDISAQVRAEAAIQATVKMNEDMLEKAPFGIFLVDPVGLIDYVNPAMCAISGLECREFVGINVFEVPAYRELGLDERIRQVFDGNPFVYGPVRYTSSLAGKNSHRIFTGIPFGEGDGRRALIFVEDVTQVRILEETIVRAKDEWERTFDAVQDLLMIVDPDKRITRANRAFAASAGRAPSEMPGRVCREFFPCRAGAGGTCLHDAVFADGGTRTEEVEDPHSGKHYLVTAYPLRSKTGGIEGVVHVARDITERKRAEKALENAFRSIKDLKDQLEMENLLLREETRREVSHEEIVGKSPAVQAVLRQVDQVGPTDSTVLLTGETGTGKELVARAIHRMSARNDRVMVRVNCAALPATLIESELFGREKGAYTGALSRQAGRFELADKSTIFLDEIGELPLELQPKLLRVLQEGEFERLGGTATIRVDVRVIAATNKDLAAEVRSGRFREDLFFRLNVFPIEVPPLKDRPGDIMDLVRHFVQEFSTRTGRKVDKIPTSAIRALEKYSWPGNVRELRNVVERAMILSKGSSLTVELPGAPVGASSRGLTLEEVQRRHIVETLRRVGWRVSGPGGAAEILDMKPTTLQSKMQKLGIRRSTGTNEIS